MVGSTALPRDHSMEAGGRFRCDVGVGHPRGVQPSTNSIFSNGCDCRSTGLGKLSVLDDALILQVLELVEYRELGRLAAVSHMLYCFANHEDLWKAVVIEGMGENGFCFSSTWKETFLQASVPSHKAPGCQPLKARGVFSDLLYQPWFLAHLEIDEEWLKADTIQRRSHLSVEDFRRDFELPNIPVVLTGAASHWPAINKWTDEYLETEFQGKRVLAGEYPMSLPQFVKYSQDTSDEMPLYLFDKEFADKAPRLEKDFSVPEYFPEDLFAALGEDKRPDYRWLIIGAEKSGSTFHKDPNSTSAWNAVVRGSKKWILYPPHITPPGVHASASGADVVTSVSLMEWFVNFYSQAQSGSPRPVEGVVGQSDVIFVPRGWWHMAINLEYTVAVTQNYVSSANLPHVLRFLRSRNADLVSGCSAGQRRTLYDEFVGALTRTAPATLSDAEEAERKHKAALGASSHLASLFAQPCTESRGTDPEKRPAGSSSSGFSFNFKV